MELSDRPQRPAMGSRESGSRASPDASGDSEAVAGAIRAFQARIEREESFRLLFETYRSAVQGFFLRRLGSPEAARDLTQETFLKVYRGLEGFRGDGPFGAWLFRIAWNVLRSHGDGSTASRLRSREVQLEDVEMEISALRSDGGRRPFDAVLGDERRRILRDAVERLPPQRRKCVVLWAYHELTYKQIAVVMRLSLGTVKAHLAQARQQLGDLVDDLTKESD